MDTLTPYAMNGCPGKRTRARSDPLCRALAGAPGRPTSAVYRKPTPAGSSPRDVRVTDTGWLPQFNPERVVVALCFCRHRCPIGERAEAARALLMHTFVARNMLEWLASPGLG